MNNMKLYCAGPRGSIASPSIASDNFYTDKYGGNTTCYYLEAGPFKIIFDMGTGAVPLGKKLVKELNMFDPAYKGTEFINLFTHYHLDHTGGLPFFVPIFMDKNTFNFHGFNPREGKEEYTESQVRAMLGTSQATPLFPVPLRELPARKHYMDHSPMFSESFYYIINASGNLQCSQESISDVFPEIKITTIPLNHPDGCLGYRIDYEGKSMAFCTDMEPARYSCDKINKIAKGVDLIVLDGQYTEGQIEHMTQGFGHGTVNSCIEQAESCEAKHLLITHFDPGNDDDTLEKMESSVRLPAIEFAREGKTYLI